MNEYQNFVLPPKNKRKRPPLDAASVKGGVPSMWEDDLDYYSTAEQFLDYGMNNVEYSRETSE